MSGTSSTPSSLKPEAQNHVDEARLNYELYDVLRRDERYLGWAATLLFYTALHMVQAYFVETAVTGFDIPKNHGEREARVLLKLTPIHREYSALQNSSEAARYFPWEPKPTLDDLDRSEKTQFSRIVAELGGRGINL